MYYYVYLIVTKINDKYISYVGYTSNLKKRVNAHNTSKGAKFTRGKKWLLLFRRRYNSKSKAMKAENKLKKNNKLRKLIKIKYTKKL